MPVINLATPTVRGLPRVLTIARRKYAKARSLQTHGTTAYSPARVTFADGLVLVGMRAELEPLMMEG